jgi:very-short-patch-repair endonuclease
MPSPFHVITMSVSTNFPPAWHVELAALEAAPQPKPIPMRPAVPTPKQPQSVPTWMPLVQTVIIFFLWVALFKLVPALSPWLSGCNCIVLTSLWWFRAYRTGYENFVDERKQAEQEASLLNRYNQENYDKVTLPDWKMAVSNIERENLEAASRPRPHRTPDYQRCLQHWKQADDNNIAITRSDGYIGPGEDELFAALERSNIIVRRQVDIDGIYTADLVCFDASHRRICVVEVDGSQHWTQDKQMRRDQDRMQALAYQGVHTIRFKNTEARRNPKGCVQAVVKLIKAI